MKPSLEMLQAPAFLALGGSGRSVLRVLLEEIDNPASTVRLETGYFLEAGLSTTAVKTGVADLMALDFIRVSGAGTANRSFSLSEGWRQISDQAEAARRIAEARTKAAAKAAQRTAQGRPQVAERSDAPEDRRLPEGVRRSRYPAMPWLQSEAS